MKLSIKNAPTESQQSLRRELEHEFNDLKRDTVNVYVTEKGLCINSLLEGRTIQTMHGYDVTNKVVQDLAVNFPRLKKE